MTKRPQLIIYTRNRDIDYRMVVTPDETLCPADTRKYFRSLIRGIIDVETYDDPLSQPRWLYAKKGNNVLFGVATMLDTLGTECCTDFTGRSVRGFYGLVFDATSTDSLQLPFSIDFFIDINRKYIEPLWNSRKEDFIRKGIEIDIDSSVGSKIGAASDPIQLNQDKDACLILGNADAEKAIRSALAVGKDISLVTGLNSKQHAFAADSEYDFMNAVVNGVSEKQMRKKVKAPAKTDKPDTPVVPPSIPARPKKALRPKVTIVGLLVLMALIIIFIVKMCNMKQTNPNSSTSGELNATGMTDTIKKTKN